MGINQSVMLRGATSTTSWKRYQVRRIESSLYSIKFFLNDSVEYSNAFIDYIHCENSYPYNEVRAGWYLEVNQGRSQFYSCSHEFTFDDNLKVIRIPEPAFAFAVVPGYRNVFRSIENGTYVIERKTERQGDLNVEYIEKIRVFNNRIVANIETFRYTRAT